MADNIKYRNGVRIGFTAPVRILFPPSLHEPRAIGQSDPKFEVQIGMAQDHPEYADLLQIYEEHARVNFPDLDPFTDLDPRFLDGNEEYQAAANRADKPKEYPQLVDQIVLKLRNNEDKAPALFDVRRKDETGRLVRLTDKEEIRRTFYAGAYVAVIATMAAYTIPANRRQPESNGVSIYPEQICFVADGERFGGVSKDDGSAFDAVEGIASNFDPTAR